MFENALNKKSGLWHKLAYASLHQWTFGYLCINNEGGKAFYYFFQQIEMKRLESDNEVLRSELGIEKEKLHTLEAAFEQMRKAGNYQFIFKTNYIYILN